MTTAVGFLKGHGTGNDFVILPDPAAALDPTPAQVRALCDRRFGLGADGILRVVASAAADVPAWMTAGSGWFMDYRNADGTLAEMCGNGARVFARYLVATGLEAAGEFLIGTRSGPLTATAAADGPVAVAMGPVDVRDPGGVLVELDGRTWPATAAFAPNPHAVAFVESMAQLHDIGGSHAGPDGVFPDGVNVEFVEVAGPGRVAMRVNERGSGETLSCGTGACAVAAVHRRVAGLDSDTVEVSVPGGELSVRFGPDGAVLSGPAQIIASGQLDPSWWGSR